MDILCILIFVIGAVASVVALVWIIIAFMLTGRLSIPQSKKQKAEGAYKRMLERLREDPTNAHLRRITLSLGRDYCKACRIVAASLHLMKCG